MRMRLVTRTPRGDAEWETLARGIIKAHMALREMSYLDLTEALVEIDVHDSEAVVRNRINRGRFNAIFFLQCLRALGVSELLLPARAETDRSAQPPAAAGEGRSGPEKR